MIVGEIRRFLRDNAPVRVSDPSGTLPTIPCRRGRNCKTDRSGTPLSEIAARLGATRKMWPWRWNRGGTVSLYEPAYTDGDESVA